MCESGILQQWILVNLFLEKKVLRYWLQKKRHHVKNGNIYTHKTLSCLAAPFLHFCQWSFILTYSSSQNSIRPIEPSSNMTFSSASSLNKEVIQVPCLQVWLLAALYEATAVLSKNQLWIGMFISLEFFFLQQSVYEQRKEKGH